MATYVVVYFGQLNVLESRPLSTDSLLLAICNIAETLELWFSTRGDFATQGKLNNTGGHFLLSQLEERGCGIWRVEARYAAKLLRLHRPASHGQE